MSSRRALTGAKARVGLARCDASAAAGAPRLRRTPPPSETSPRSSTLTYPARPAATATAVTAAATAAIAATRRHSAGPFPNTREHYNEPGSGTLMDPSCSAETICLFASHTCKPWLLFMDLSDKQELNTMLLLMLYLANFS